MNELLTRVPEPKDSELAATAFRLLDSALKADDPVRLRTAGEAVDLVVPPAVLVILAEVLDTFAKGEGVTVVANHAELTSQQAADTLNVSRPFLIGLLTSGQIEYRTVGSHRRVSAASLIRYMKEDDAHRKSAADALTAEAHTLGLA